MKLTKFMIPFRLALINLMTISTIAFSFGVNAITKDSLTQAPLKNDNQVLLLAQQIVDGELYTATLQGCNRSGTTVRCFVAVRAKENKTFSVFCIYGPHMTRIFDSFGNVSVCSQVQIGNAKDNEWFLGIRFPAGTPLKITYTFKGVSSDINQLEALEIKVGDYYAKFSNIPLQ